MSPTRPKVSVGMPAYNAERHLQGALDSILGQTFGDLELIISDNASTDSTEDICREYVSKDPRVRYHRHPKNLGASENYNTVFRRASGIYFKWASSNDLCDPEFLEACVQVLDHRPDVVLSYPRTRLLKGDSGQMEDYEDRLDLPHESPCSRFKAFWERARLNNVMNGLIRVEPLHRTPLMAKYRDSDRVLMSELTLYGKFVEVPKFMFFRRMDPSSTMILRGAEGIHRHYDPEMRRRMLFQRWKFHRGCLSAVLRTPLPAAEKVCLSRFLWRRFYEDRGYLARELREAGRAWGMSAQPSET